LTLLDPDRQFVVCSARASLIRRVGKILNIYSEVQMAFDDAQDNCDSSRRELKMDRQEVHETVKRLHDELDRMELPDSNQREILKKVAREIQDMLARQEGMEHIGGLRERLKESVAQIEASHSEATLLMRQVIDQLAYMGI
jgi:hypothetical protein